MQNTVHFSTDGMGCAAWAGTRGVDYRQSRESGVQDQSVYQGIQLLTGKMGSETAAAVKWTPNVFRRSRNCKINASVFVNITIMKP